MTRRTTRVLATAAASAGLVLAGPATAGAQSEPASPTAAFCSGDTLVSQRLANGALWEMCWGTHALKGLVLSKVAFQGPQEDAPRLVLDQIATVQMNVPYDNGAIEYDDVLQYGFGGRFLQALAPSECPGGELRDATVQWETNTGVFNERTIPALCIREDETGLAYRSQWRTGGQLLTKQGTDLVVSSTAAIGNYEYEMQYRFHDDGQIDALIGATGDAVPFGSSYIDGWPVGAGEADFLMNHYHSGVWRVDFGLDGQDEQRVEQWDSGPTGRRGAQSAIYRSTRRDVAREALLRLANRRWFRVVAPESRNADDHPRSYELAFARNDPYSSYPHLRYELSFSQYRACEQFPMRNPTAIAGCGNRTVLDYVDGEAVTDPIAWVNVGYHHVPRDEDQSPMPVHWQGFSMVPRDWHAQNSQIPSERAGVNGDALPEPTPPPAR